MTPVPIRDVMSREFVGVGESDGLRETVALLRENDADAAVVLRGDDPVGFLSARDVLDHVAAGDVDDVTVGDAMADPPTALRPEATLADAANAIRRTDSDHLLVSDGDGLIGVVTVRDVTTASRATVEPVPDADGATPESGPPDDRDRDVAADDFSAQSVCEVCGGLAGSLTNVNGQLVCADCHQY
ncbi:inosine-5-monophosphate dehydrogenase [Halarchaeum grantii]|uniref:Inosine-5-monophosphate dehydrogenase n=1 Tax=Halarchaeum grantii TaxID=1193105 RepID=A0A830ERR6_9EURY|nr:CBS domain-containing protein [Halarchaeum grantii]GGL23522.1 inosine-5-monophosphate dehydrogenase [Halarchaeum grantii]